MDGFEIFQTNEIIYMLHLQNFYSNFRQPLTYDLSVPTYTTKDNLEVAPPMQSLPRWNTIR
jgi:hypothetical protein